MEDDLVDRLLKRAEIRRQIPTRKSVQEGKTDRIADLLEEAAEAIKCLREKTILKQLEDLEEIAEAYHKRDGTFNFHYSKFELVPWDVDYSREMSKEQWDSLDVEDWIVRIVWLDNSHSTDCYSVPLKEILKWHQNENSRSTSSSS